MNIEVLENPEQELIDYLDKKIDDFNWANWEVSKRSPLAAQIKNEQGCLLYTSPSPRDKRQSRMPSSA